MTDKLDNAFILGGGNIYSQFLPLADKIYLTEIEDECADADTYFPQFDKNDYTADFIAEYEVNDIKFKHICYTKK